MIPLPIISIEHTPDTHRSWLSPPDPRPADVRPTLRVPSVELASQLRDLLPRPS